MSEVKKGKRVYQAVEVDGEEAAEVAARLDREKRKRLAEEWGEGIHWKENKQGERVGIEKLNPDYFAALFAASGEVFFEPEESRIYCYGERHLWEVKSEDELRVMVGLFLLAESRREEEGSQFVQVKRTAIFEREVVAKLRGMEVRRGVFQAAWERDRKPIQFKNGVVCVEGGKVGTFREEFTKTDYLRSRIEFAYEVGKDCPRTVEELLLPCFDPETAEEDVDLLFQFFGVFLVGVNVGSRMLILEGAARSGKSTVQKLAVALVGAAATMELRTEHLDGRFEFAAFAGRSLLYGPDVSPDFLTARGAGVLKRLTGGDFLDGELKAGNERVRLKGIFNALVVTNGELRVRLAQDVEAWRRRLAILTFRERVIDEKVLDFEKVLLREESAGILNRALEGLSKVMAAGGEFVLSESQKARVDDMLAASDPVLEYVEERLERKEGGSIPKWEILDGVKKGLRERRWRVPSDKELGGRIREAVEKVFEVPEVNGVQGLSREHVEKKNMRGYNRIGWVD